MNARLDDRVAEPDLVVTALLVMAAGLYLAFAGWLIAAQVGAGGVRHVPTVTIDNQTNLTLEIGLPAELAAVLAARGLMVVTRDRVPWSLLPDIRAQRDARPRPERAVASRSPT